MANRGGGGPSPGWRSIGDEYRYGLRDLTFNSRPIINNLTLFAQDHLSSAPALAQVLTDHLINCPEEYKLPALYLIDSILKNIGEPYVGLLSTLLPRAFVETFRQLGDERTRRDFLRTVETWWNIFPAPLIGEIQHRALAVAPPPSLGPRRFEGANFQGRAVRPHLETQPVPRAGPPTMPSGKSFEHATTVTLLPPQLATPTTFTPYVPSYVLPEILIRILLDLRSAMTVPPELYNEKFVADVMYRLEYECQALGDMVLFRAVDERARIPDKRHLINLIDSVVAFKQGGRSYEQASLPMRPPRFQSNIHHPQSGQLLTEQRHPTSRPHTVKSPVLVPHGRGHHYVENGEKFSPPPPPSSSLSSIKSPIPPQQSPDISTLNLPDISPLLASLSNLPLNLSSLNLPDTLAIKPPSLQSPKISLIYEELIQRQPDAYKILYDALPRQCTNCGLRFPDTSEGKRRLDAHLDAHFRRNIRLKDKAKKVLARLWWSPETEWITSKELYRENEVPAVLFASATSMTSKTDISNAVEGGDKARNMVKAESDHADRTCSLCHEKINIIWDDESDEWMYKDAIKIEDGEIVHDYCHNNATTINNHQ